jgi:natural product biosynthesis luciferase-like monooxygenase protein
MEFGIMFFSSAAQAGTSDIYKLVKEAVRFADQHNFCGIWTPERHFHDFGGPFPSPSVLSAAIAMITENIQIRAGSLISPLHSPIRIAEEWSLVDNLSMGRAAISFGSGWNINDFIFFPDRYSCRQSVMYEQISVIQDLWQGKTIRQCNPAGKEIEIKIFPKPIQPRLPLWITSSGNVETFISAGKIGANVLTHMIGQDIVSLAKKIATYRQVREAHGYDRESGIVSLMLHTYLGTDPETVLAETRQPFRDYLRSAVALESKSARSGGVISGGHNIRSEEIASDDMEQLLDLTFERYYKTAALLGTPTACRDLIGRFEEAGVNEIACLIDFGIDSDRVLSALEHLDTLRRMCMPVAPQAIDQAVEEFTADF